MSAPLARSSRRRIGPVRRTRPLRPARSAHLLPQPGEVIARLRQARPSTMRSYWHARLYRPPHPADDPDDVRDHADLLRDRAVRAGRAGGAHDRAAAGQRHVGDLAHRRRRRRRLRGGGQSQPGGGGEAILASIAARRGSTRNSSSSWRRSSASTSRPIERFGKMLWNYAALRFRQELFPRRVGAAADQGEAAGLDLARAVDDAPLLRDLDPARHPQGGEGRLALRHLDLGGRHHRLCDPGLPVRDPADRAVRRRLVLADLSAARPDLREFRRSSPGTRKIARLPLAHRAADHWPWRWAPSRPRRC